MSPTATIIGAGIGGLALGRALRADGWQVALHERSGGLPETGTALGMWPEALDALDALGLGEEVRDRGVHQAGAEFLRPDGTTFARVRPKRPSYLVSRPVLHEILYSEDLEDSISWSSPISEPHLPVDVDLVVGADGIHSKLRSVIVGPDSAPRPLGTVAFRGVVPGSVNSVTETWGDGRVFGITPQDPRTTNWFACIRADLLRQCEGTDDHAELLGQLFGHWHPAITDVLSHLESVAIDRRTLYDIPPLRSHVRGNRVIIGDAAHAMAPNAGRGACEALIDAVHLADSLRAADSVEQGLLEYDRSRRRPTQQVVRMSRIMNRMSTARRFGRSRRAAMNVLAHAA